MTLRISNTDPMQAPTFKNQSFLNDNRHDITAGPTSHS